MSRSLRPSAIHEPGSGATRGLPWAMRFEIAGASAIHVTMRLCGTRPPPATVSKPPHVFIGSASISSIFMNASRICTSYTRCMPGCGATKSWMYISLGAPSWTSGSSPSSIE